MEVVSKQAYPQLSKCSVSSKCLFLFSLFVFVSGHRHIISLIVLLYCPSFCEINLHVIKTYTLQKKLYATERRNHSTDFRDFEVRLK